MTAYAAALAAARRGEWRHAEARFAEIVGPDGYYAEALGDVLGEADRLLEAGEREEALVHLRLVAHHRGANDLIDREVEEARERLEDLGEPGPASSRSLRDAHYRDAPPHHRLGSRAHDLLLELSSTNGRERSVVERELRETLEALERRGELSKKQRRVLSTLR